MTINVGDCEVSFSVFVVWSWNDLLSNIRFAGQSANYQLLCSALFSQNLFFSKLLFIRIIFWFSKFFIKIIQ